MGFSLKSISKSVNRLGGSAKKAFNKTVSNVKAIEKKVESNAKSPLVGTILSTVNPALGLSYSAVASTLFKPKAPPPDEVVYEEGPTASDEALPDQTRIAGVGNIGKTPFDDLITALMGGGTIAANARVPKSPGSSISTEVARGDSAVLAKTGFQRFVVPVALGIVAVLLFVLLRRKK